MSDQQHDPSNQSNEISIEDLQLSLQVYEIESDQKLQKLKQLFKQKQKLDLRQTFYEERSSLEVKFQSIISDLTEFLITQQVPSTQKLRRTFYRILESPFLLLFKVSRFEIFNLRLNAFDIELEPIQAICELAALLQKNIQQYTANQKNFKSDNSNSEYQSYEQFLEHAKINLISDQIFILYSYLRKGSNILKKKFEDIVKVIQIFNNTEGKLIQTLLKNQDAKTLKELSILNYEIYLLENSFDVICFFLRIPLKQVYKQCFKQLQILGNKAKTTCNFDMFIYIFVKYNTEIIAKINQQGIDPYFVSYIENCLTALLDLWGCRVCHYKQFFQLFKSLFYIHPNQKYLLQKCLKHTPNLSKDDIALLRANIRQHIDMKHTQLLSLMKKQTLQDINGELNQLYHQIMYNLDFKKESKEKIIELLTLMNGNSNIQQFFSTAEKAFKEWNYTIDFFHQHKFIQTQFKIPKLSKNQILESLRIFTNVCSLEQKGFDKEYQQLVSKGTLNKALIGLVKFFLSNKQALELLKQQILASQLIIAAFKLLQKTMPPNSQEWQSLSLDIAICIEHIPKEQKSSLQNELASFILKNPQSFHLSKFFEIFSIIFKSISKQEEPNRIQQIISLFIQFFMKQTNSQSKQINNFRFIGLSVQSLKSIELSNEQSDFLRKYCCVQNNETIEVKQLACFKLSQLQIITNPIQFQKALDNYYLSLDPNSKRFIQYIAERVAQLTVSRVQQGGNTIQLEFYFEILQWLLSLYPICIPILCNVRVKTSENAQNNDQIRFVQFLAAKICTNKDVSSRLKKILASILNCRKIKYRNGKDYIVQQIVAMILKTILKIVNTQVISSKGLTVQAYQALVLTLSKMKLGDLKADIIQKSIEKINFEIQGQKNQKQISTLSKCNHQLFDLFFKKKEIDIKKKNLSQTYKSIVWNEIRTFNLSSLSNKPKPVSGDAPKISEQIMVSPYTLSQQYNLNEYKLKKGQQKIKIDLSKPFKQAQQNKLKLSKGSEIISKLSTRQSHMKLIPTMDKGFSGTTRQIDLSKMKYDIAYHLSVQEVESFQSKQNIAIRQKYTSINPSRQHTQSSEKSITFVQYYLRQLAYPQVSEQIALRTILSYLKNEIGISYVWSNPKNLQKIFSPLIVLFDYATQKQQIKQVKKLQSIAVEWRQIIECVNSDKVNCIKQIINTFSDIGYHNLWGQNYKSTGLSESIRKALEVKQLQTDSFLALVLKKSLDYEFLSQIKNELNNFLSKLFSSRPQDQTTLMYKVGIDKNLLNLIMKSLEIQNLTNLSFLFHSNFNNLRLYTDQLHQGLKALNMASKTRSYNQYIQLAKQIDDQQFTGPMKLFQENFNFFIKIEKEGYNFKRNEEKKLAIQRLLNILRNYQDSKKEQICIQCDKIIEQYINQIQQLQLSIANRVKSFYLVTKLRDLSYQNAISISLIRQILKQKSLKTQQILNEIKKVDIFSVFMKLHKELVLFDEDWTDQKRYQNYHKIDNLTIQRNISAICTTRRFSHSMSKVYEKCDLQLDEVLQRCIDQLKMFLQSTEGKQYLKEYKDIINPAFLVKSFISNGNQAEQFKNQITKNLLSTPTLQDKTFNQQIIKIELTNKASFITDCASKIRAIHKSKLHQKGSVQILYEGKIYTLDSFLPILKDHLIRNQTLVWTKSKQTKFLTFNRYKSSEATLQQIEVLGYVLSYCFFHNIALIDKTGEEIVPLHSSIVVALNFGMADIDDLLDIDFKVWEDIKKVLTLQDSKTLNLNFSYLFQNVKTLKEQRVELIDKGSSKKVNNLNREQYCDSVCCFLLYKNIEKQIFKLIQSVLTISPKQFLACTSMKRSFQLFYNKKNLQLVMKRYMKKLGIVKPEVIFYKGQRIENLKDYQNIQWAQQILLQNQKVKEKIWKNQTNLCILTTIGGKGSVQFTGQVLVVHHFPSKKQMQVAFKSI